MQRVYGEANYLPLTWLIASSQAKGTKSTSFLMRKERSGLSTLGLRRWVLSPLRSLCVRNEVDLVPLACEDGLKGEYHG